MVADSRGTFRAMSTRRTASDADVHRAFVALAEAKSGADAIRVFDNNPNIRGASFVAAVWYRTASTGLGAGHSWDGETLDRLTRALYSALVKESAKCAPQVLVAAAAACSLHAPKLPPGRLARHADLISARVSQRSAEFDLGQLASVSQALSVVSLDVARPVAVEALLLLELHPSGGTADSIASLFRTCASLAASQPRGALGSRASRGEPSSLHRQGALTRKALRLLAASLHSRCTKLSDRGLVDAAHALAEALKASPPMASPGETAVARLRVSLAAAVAGRGLSCPPSVLAVVAPVAIPAASCVNDQASEAARLAKWIAAALVTAPGPEAHAAALARAVDASVAAGGRSEEGDSSSGRAASWDAGAALSCIRTPSAPAPPKHTDDEGDSDTSRVAEDAAWALDEEAAFAAVSGLLAATATARPEGNGAPPAALLGGLRSSVYTGASGVPVISAAGVVGSAAGSAAVAHHSPVPRPRGARLGFGVLAKLALAAARAKLPAGPERQALALLLAARCRRRFKSRPSETRPVRCDTPEAVAAASSALSLLGGDDAAAGMLAIVQEMRWRCQALRKAGPTANTPSGEAVAASLLVPAARVAAAAVACNSEKALALPTAALLLECGAILQPHVEAAAARAASSAQGSEELEDKAARSATWQQLLLADHRAGAVAAGANAAAARSRGIGGGETGLEFLPAAACQDLLLAASLVPADARLKPSLPLWTAVGAQAATAGLGSRGKRQLPETEDAAWQRAAAVLDLAPGSADSRPAPAWLVAELAPMPDEQLRVAGSPSAWRPCAGKWLPELRLERHGGGHVRSSAEATLVAVPPTGLAWAMGPDDEPWGKPVVPDCDTAALIAALELAGMRPVVVEPGASHKDLKEGLVAAWSERR